MAKFKIILSDPDNGTSQIIDLEGARAVPLVGRKLGETLDGAAIGLGGHKLKITGGSDRDGFPMRPDIHGGVKARVILTKGLGFHSKKQGDRRRKTVRGCVITEEIVQINMKIAEKPRTAEHKPPEKAQAKEKQKPEITEKTKEAERLTKDENERSSKNEEKEASKEAKSESNAI